MVRQRKFKSSTSATSGSEAPESSASSSSVETVNTKNAKSFLKWVYTVLAFGAIVCVYLFLKTMNLKADEDREGIDFWVVSNILHKYKHVNRPFTQGLLILDEDLILESSGGYGDSYIQLYNYKTGRVVKKISVGEQYFAEGIAIRKDEETGADHLHMLTWRESKVLVYHFNQSDNYNITYLHQYPIKSDGWGLINYHDGLFLATNGSAVSSTFIANTGQIVDARPFTCFGQQMPYVNELQVVGDQIIGNVFGQDIIMYFNIDTLECEKVVACYGLYDLNSEGIRHDPNNDVLNGIGHHASFGDDKLILTGKRWPWLYEVGLERKGRARTIGGMQSMLNAIRAQTQENGGPKHVYKESQVS